MVSVAEAVESQHWLDADLLMQVAEIRVDVSDDVEIIAERVNRSYWDGTLPGMPAPRIDGSGRVVDPDKRRAYSIGEIAAVLETDSCKRAIEALRAERQAERDAEAAQQKRDQLAHARVCKQCRGERSLVPRLYAQVKELTDTVEFLLEKIDQMGTAEGRRVRRYLPELRD